MSGLFTCIAIFSCKSSYGGVHSDFLVGYCSPGNFSDIVGGGVFLLGIWNGFQEGKVRQGKVG